MMLPFTPDIDPQVDRIVEAWVSGLSIWQLDTAAGSHGICRVCLRYAAELQLDELPHDLLHLLAAPLESLIVEHADSGDDSPLGDLAVAEVLRRRAVGRVLPRHSSITWAVEAYVEPQVRRLVARLMEETCGR
jgi:hypothetical protein